MHTKSMVMLVCVASCASPAPAPAPAATVSTTPSISRSSRDAYAAIGSSIRDEITAGRLTGVSVALVQHGTIVWEEGFGWADRDAGRIATHRTAFSIASITKPFTTTAVMTLVAARKIALDHAANDYLGVDKIVDASGPAQQVTVRRLASHASGLPTFFEMYEHGDGQPSVAEQVRDYGHIVAPVGERYEYSNLAMAILGDMVARQSGQEFGQYLQDHVLTPLGMHDSFFDTDVARRPTMAVRYDDAGDPLPFYLTATPGSGEMYTSAHDLARFAMFHLKDTVAGQVKILTAAQLDELHRPVTDVAAPTHAYAMGWQVLRRPAEPDVLYHTGGQPGVTSELVLVPSLDIACVVLSNRRSSTFLAGVRDRMLQTVAAGWHGIPKPATSRLQPLAPLADYVGEWRGELIAQGRHVAVSLTIERDRRGNLAIDRGPAAPITEFGLIDGLISGETKGEIGSPDTRRKHLTALSLNLKLRGQVIDGEIIAWALNDKHMTILPHWVELHLQPSR